MGLFNNLFGSSSKGKEQEAKVRAQFRDAKYFQQETDRCNRFIEADKKNDIEYFKQHGRLTAFHYLSAASIRNQKIETLYSIGANIQELLPIFQESIENFSSGWSEEYQDYPLLLQMVSFALLLEVEKDEMNKIKDFINIADGSAIEEIWKPDSLIFFLLNEEDKKRVGDKPYELLYNITQLPKEKAEEAIKEYLDKWYEMHKEDPWYNTHLRDKGYSGYWAWEVGAVVKKMNLDDSSFKDHPFYPYDMVHWKKDNEKESH